ncbi:MAG TPA: PA14 domain-containing protein [Pirellulales bacterium]|nr:PA14 domain-containing protein [Pirellulales bacterium]
MEFNAYHKWLGIPPEEQPADHYRLLAITRFESDPDVIEGAADRQMAHVRTFQAGPHSPDSQRLLNELSAAKLCLLDTEKKAVYDDELRRRAGTLRKPAAIPIAKPLVTPQVNPSAAVDIDPSALIVAGDKPASHAAHKRGRRSSQAAYAWLALAAVAVPAMLVVGYLVVNKPVDPELQNRPVKSEVAGSSATGQARGALAKRVPTQHERGARGTTKSSAEQKAPELSRVEEASLAGPGLKTELFRDRELKELVKTRIDPNIDWLWAWSAPDDELPADGFSVRWSGWLKPPRPGEYKFAIVGDDGIRLSLNGTMLIDLWGGHLAVQKEATIDLTGEAIRVQVEHYDEGMSSLASLRWTPPGGSREEPVPAAVLFRDRQSAEQAPSPAALGEFDPASGHGLPAEIFDGMNFEKKLLSRIDPDINFTWGQNGPTPEVLNDYFSVRWTGWLKAPQPGKYRIGFIADDGVRVWIDEKLVIDEWHGQYPTRLEAEVQLSTRAVPLKIEYFEADASAVASLRWLPPNSTSEEVIPRECLFQRNPDESANAVVAATSPLPPADNMKPAGTHIETATELTWDQPLKKPPQPDAAALAAAVTRADALFADETRQSTTPEQRLALARREVDWARWFQAETEVRYVLSQRAFDLATTNGDAVTACRALEVIAMIYDTGDLLEARVKAIERAAKSSATEELAWANTLIALSVADAVLDTERPDLLKALAQAARESAARSKSPTLFQRAQALPRSTSREQRRGAYKQALGTLKQESDVQTANLTAGRYEMLVLGDWKAGAEHWSRLTDAGHKELLRLDRDAYHDPRARIDAARAWWNAAGGAGKMWKTDYQLQAKYWCQHSQQDAPLPARADASWVKKALAVPGFARTRYRRGVMAEFYNGAEFQDFRVRRVDRNIDWLFGDFAPHPKVGFDFFSIRWSGFFKPPVPGTWRIVVHTDDGMRVWIDGTKVLDFFNGAVQDQAVELSLSDDLHSIRFEYNDYTSGAAAICSWCLVDGGQRGLQPLPAESFFYELASPYDDPLAP